MQMRFVFALLCALWPLSASGQQYKYGDVLVLKDLFCRSKEDVESILLAAKGAGRDQERSAMRTVLARLLESNRCAEGEREVFIVGEVSTIRNLRYGSAMRTAHVFRVLFLREPGIEYYFYTLSPQERLIEAAR